MRTIHKLFLSLTVLLTGVAGCKKDPKLGEPCKIDGEATCAGASMIICAKSGKWEEVACQGPDGCKTRESLITCDETLASLNAPCGTGLEEHYSCSSDRKSQLRCENAQWVLSSSCAGAEGCKTQGSVVHCDTSIGAVDDPCRDEGNVSCSTDGTTILECKNRKMVVAQKCETGKCTVQGKNVKCQ